MSREVSLVDLIVHEMRTPLTVALGSIRHAEADPAIAVEALARARRSCERLERLAAEMRDFVRVQALPDETLATVDLDALLDAAVARLRLERDIAVAISSGPLARHALALKSHLEHAVTAVLLALARAASPSDTLVITATSEGDGLRVVARRDSAPGDSSFETFDAEWVGGLGFGLPLARAVVERGGGTIQSAVAPDGRVGLISVTLAAAPAPPPP